MSEEDGMDDWAAAMAEQAEAEADVDVLWSSIDP